MSVDSKNPTLKSPQTVIAVFYDGKSTAIIHGQEVQLDGVAKVKASPGKHPKMYVPLPQIVQALSHEISKGMEVHAEKGKITSIRLYDCLID